MLVCDNEIPKIKLSLKFAKHVGIQRCLLRVIILLLCQCIPIDKRKVEN